MKKSGFNPGPGERKWRPGPEPGRLNPDPDPDPDFAIPNLTTMSIDELQSSLLVHEQRMQTPSIEEQALKVTHEDISGARGRGRGGFRGRGRGR